jgi:hypothetical protein
MRHGEVYPGQVATGCVRYVPASQRPGRQQHRVVPFPQLRDRDVGTDRAAGHELHTFGP